MQLGDFELRTVSGGHYWIDGGTMFGVVPRVMWERQWELDDQNRIPQRTNCLLVETGSKRVLIDTGFGSKLTDKQRRQINAEDGDPLRKSLEEQGVAPADIDVVVFTHLHFDHAGGATTFADQQQREDLVPTFPRAEYVVQRREWMNATANLPELRGAYSDDNLRPLSESGRLRLIDGDVEIEPGLRAIVTGGHTDGHQAVAIESGGQTAVYVGDICATTRHLPVLWCLGYDVHMQQTRRAKRDLLGLIADQNWLALFPHDPNTAAARLRRDSHKDFLMTDALLGLV